MHIVKRVPDWYAATNTEEPIGYESESEGVSRPFSDIRTLWWSIVGISMRLVSQWDERKGGQSFDGRPAPI